MDIEEIVSYDYAVVTEPRDLLNQIHLSKMLPVLKEPVAIENIK